MSGVFCTGASFSLGRFEANLRLLCVSANWRAYFSRYSDYYPWDYCLYHRNIALLAKRQPSNQKNRHIQPAVGPERAFGEALREIRKEHGISQEQLALDSGLDRTYVSLIERGTQSPTIRSVLKIADVLGVKASEIVARMETLMPKARASTRRG